MDKIRKIMRKQIHTADKLVHFRWTIIFITSNGEEIGWVVGGPRVNLQQITKNTLNFMAMEWQTLVRHRLCPTSGDNVLSPFWVTLIAWIMKGYDLDVAQFIFREINDRAIGTDTVLTFPCLLMQMCINAGVSEIYEVYQFIHPRNTTDLGFIHDAITPISKIAKIGEILHAKEFWTKGPITVTHPGF